MIEKYNNDKIVICNDINQFCNDVIIDICKNVYEYENIFDFNKWMIKKIKKIHTSLSKYNSDNYIIVNDCDKIYFIDLCGQKCCVFVFDEYDFIRCDNDDFNFDDIIDVICNIGYMVEITDFVAKLKILEKCGGLKNVYE